LTSELARALRGGDIAMIKGSNGSRMGPLVAALRDHFADGAKGGDVRC
jgi:UDP-N-acetylmuramyl pentapeptide synthase